MDLVKWLAILCLFNTALGSEETAVARVLRKMRKPQYRRRKEDKILTWYGTYYVCRTPRYRSCFDADKKVFASIKVKGGEQSVPSGTTILTGVIGDFGRLGCRNVAPYTYSIFGGFNNRSWLTRFYRPNHTVSNIQLYVYTPKGYRDSPGVFWHTVGTFGPGWIDLRFLTLPDVITQTFTFGVTYRRQTYDTMNDIAAEETHEYLVNQYVNGSQPHMFTVMPDLKCPEWESKKMYCVLLSDFVRPNPPGGRKYTDYVILIYTYRVLYGSMLPTSSLVEYVDTVSKAYKCVVRVWDTCDPTGYVGRRCRKIMAPVQGFQGAKPRKPDSYYYSEIPDEEDDVIEEHLVTQPPDDVPEAIKTLRGLWPLFLALFLISLFIVLPLVYFLTRRKAKNDVMKNWYYFSTPDGKLHFIMWVPEDMPRWQRTDE